MKRYKYLLLLWLTLPVCLPAQSLADYLVMAGDNNLELKAAFTRYLAATERIGQQGQLPDPQVSFAAFLLPIETRVGPQQANIGIRQMFPWFGSRAAARSLAARNAEVVLQSCLELKNEIYFQVRRQYYRMHQLEKDIAATRENLKIMDGYAALTQRQYEGGMVDMVDIVRVKMAINELGERLLQLEEKRAVLLAEFNSLVNRPADTPVDIPAKIPGVTQDIPALRDSLSLHPAFAVYQAQKAALDQAEEVNRLAHRPQMSVGLNYVLVGQRTDAAVEGNGRDALMPSVGLSIPLNKKKQWARDQELQRMREAVDYEAEARHQELTASFVAVEADLKAAERRMLLYTKQIRQVDQALEMLMVEYAAGGTDMVDVLEMQVQRLDYQLALDKAQTDQLIQYAKVRSLIGPGSGASTREEK